MEELSGASPAIGVPARSFEDVVDMPVLDAHSNDEYDGSNYGFLRPSYAEYTKDQREAVRLLLPAPTIPDPTKVSSADPEVDQIINSHVIDSLMFWGDFVRGVACASHAIDRRFQSAVPSALDVVANRLQNGRRYPKIDSEFKKAVEASEEVILQNGEMVTRRQLLAFLNGAYWVLGFIKRPNVRRGERSPLEFVSEMVNHFGRLAVVPRD